jgi:pyruvate dehydrogenase E2 component (dihydrolipoamide acetyltransferase)
VARDVEGAPAGTPEAGKRLAAGPAVPVPTHEAGGPAYEDLPLSMMRKAIARKMTESKTTVPHFQLTRKIRAEALLQGREALKARFPELKVTLNDILVKACATALRQHPAVNSQFLGDAIRRFHTVDVAVAVGTGEGLITPVVRNADRKGLAALSAEIKALAAKAQEKKLTPEDYSGGTFTLSNLGMYGVTEFNAIINTPQACILAVSSVVSEPVVEDGALAVGRTMNMTLSSDHRVVDGVTAAQFMDTLAALLENPLAMLL